MSPRRPSLLDNLLSPLSETEANPMCALPCQADPLALRIIGSAAGQWSEAPSAILKLHMLEHNYVKLCAYEPWPCFAQKL